MKIIIGLIYSFSTQVEMAKLVTAKFQNRPELLFDYGILDDAIPVAKKMVAEGAETIIAMGGTAKVLEEHVSVPVIPIRVGILDIIKAVELARKFSPKIAITSEIPVKGIDLIEKLYEVTVKQIIFTDKNDFLYGLTKAVQDGCEVIIGKSKLAVELAEQYGAKGVLVTYDLDILGEAMHEAIRMAVLRRREKEQYILLETIFDNLSEGIIVIDKNASITRFNLAASNILKCQPKEMIGSRISEQFAALKMEDVLQNQIPINNELVTIGDLQILIDYTPIILGKKIIGVVSTFRQASEIQKMDSKIRKALREKGFKAQYAIDHFVANSPRMKDIIKEARQYAQVDLTTLLIGETGTGKEVLAQSIHNLSPRRRGPFVAINCSVLPDNLLESELFGYDEGAFTGARKGGKPGLFELAQHGTILLDEINTIPLKLQAKLLRVLQEREVMRVGGAHIIPVDVKIIAAANQDIFHDLEEKRFRLDLYYRLNQLCINLPRLQDRKEDIPELAQVIFADLRKKFSKKPFSLPSACIKRLHEIPWQGNVRELQNFMGRLALLCENEKDIVENIDKIISENQLYYHFKQTTAPDPSTNNDNHKKNLLEEHEKSIIQSTLEECNHNISKTARRLGVSRTTIYRKINKL
ncbi:MAG: sigma 54-interacting transcriptional regulator [Deltaproteobacteria bacterium]|nr:sigma 54-interacting transcriptional regulator [Candidatus Tharpella sp.]